MFRIMLDPDVVRFAGFVSNELDKIIQMSRGIRSC